VYKEKKPPFVDSSHTRIFRLRIVNGGKYTEALTTAALHRGNQLWGDLINLSIKRSRSGIEIRLPRHPTPVDTINLPELWVILDRLNQAVRWEHNRLTLAAEQKIKDRIDKAPKPPRYN
jgi:hypothetical protein